MKKVWNKNNKQKKKEWNKNNKKSVRASQKKWSENNKEKARMSVKKWRLENRHTINAWLAKRRAIKKQAIPSWADMQKIKKIYKQSETLTAATGLTHHVDHIYPLQSHYMCGFHVENNLQILTAEENFRKSNQVWPGQLDCQKGSICDIFPKELTDLLND